VQPAAAASISATSLSDGGSQAEAATSPSEAEVPPATRVTFGAQGHPHVVHGLAEYIAAVGQCRLTLSSPHWKCLELNA